MKNNLRSAILLADLGFGDAGKGSLVDYLARITQTHTVVRYNGGAQAAHNVVTPGGRHHTFAQFGSGTFLPGVQTHLSRHVLLHPLAMLEEERHLQSVGVHDAFSRTSVDRAALVITPFQQAANRLKEMARGPARHGSCGMGIGETTSDHLAYGDQVLFASDLADPAILVKKLRFLRDAKITQLEPTLRQLERSEAAQAELDQLFDPQVVELTADIYHYFSRQVRLVEPGALQAVLQKPGVTIFEGAQGVLLDEWWGFYPYNSWSTLTFQNADHLLSEACFSGQVYKLGLLRGYATRHGAGPFPTQDAQLTAQFPDLHNRNNLWQQDFRVGYLDMLTVRYAIRAAGPLDGLAITNLDRMDAFPQWKVCHAYCPPPGTGIEKHFNTAGGQVTGIKLPEDPTDLASQETLTRQLMDMQPVYTRLAKDRPAYVREISKYLDLPAAVLSWGSTANEKSNLALPFSSL